MKKITLVISAVILAISVHAQTAWVSQISGVTTPLYGIFFPNTNLFLLARANLLEMH